VKLLASLGKVIDLSKVAIGFETLGVDMQVQMKSYADKALPYTDVAPGEKWKGGDYWKQCETNLTKAGVASGALNGAMVARCSEPLVAQQWGLQLNATEMVGLEKAVKAATGKDLAGVGVYTLAGILAVDPSHAASDEFQGKCRAWYPALRDLNKHYKIAPRCGSNCWDEKARCPNGGNGPAPPAMVQDYCGSDWADANSRCHAPCKDDKSCAGFKEKCFSFCTKCTPQPGPAPTPAGPAPPAPGPSPAGSKWGCDRWDPSGPTCKQASTGFDTQSDCQIDCKGPPPAPGPGPAHACTGCFAGSSGTCKSPTDSSCFDRIGGQCPGGTDPC
jgi:hypothetical protein